MATHRTHSGLTQKVMPGLIAEARNGSRRGLTVDNEAEYRSAGPMPTEGGPEFLQWLWRRMVNRDVQRGIPAT